MRRRHSWVFTVAALVATAGPAAAQVPQGPELQVNTHTTLPQQRPAVTRLNSGDFVVVWDSQLQDDPNEYAVRGQRLDASGNKRGAEFAVNVFTAGDQSHADVAATPDGGFVATWQGYGALGSGVYARVFPASGAGGPEFQVGSSGSRYPAVAVSPAGLLAFSWENNTDIKARLFSSGGTPIADEYLVAMHGSPNGPSLQRPDVTWLDKGLTNDKGGYVVVWAQRSEQQAFPVWRRTFDLGANAWQLATYTLGTNGRFPSVSADANGNYVVAWTEITSTNVVMAKGFNPDGTQTPFVTTVGTATYPDRPGLSRFPTGEFAVTWQNSDGGDANVRGRLFNSSGTALASAFQANTYTTGDQATPVVATGAGESLLVTWVSPGQDGQGGGIFAQAYGRLQPFALAVDDSGNKVLDPGETAVVAPTWKNLTTSPVSSTGMATAFAGPSGFAYSKPDSSAFYASIAPSATGSCGSDCYAVSVTVTGPRPAPHVDATLAEKLGAAIVSQAWILHIGDSFTDVPTSHDYYKSVETALHRGIPSLECSLTGDHYCPSLAVTRAQVTVYLLKGKDGGSYSPQPCGMPLFTDVAASNPYCPYIEEAYHRGIVTHCGSSLTSYCPGDSVSRGEAAKLAVLTMNPSSDPDECVKGDERFDDVPFDHEFCRWIEEADRHGFVDFCQKDERLFCPDDDAERAWMADVIVRTFGLTLYGP